MSVTSTTSRRPLPGRPRQPDAGRQRDLRAQAEFHMAGRQAIKVRALQLLGQGIPPLVVSRRIGASVESVHRWKKQASNGKT
jgi:hypothetical protein